MKHVARTTQGIIPCTADPIVEVVLLRLVEREGGLAGEATAGDQLEAELVCVCVCVCVCTYVCLSNYCLAVFIRCVGYVCVSIVVFVRYESLLD